MPHKPALYLATFFALFSLYLLTYTPRINASDGLAMFATAESLLRQGTLPVEQIRWMGLQQGTYGLDGLLYSRKGIGVPIAMLPLTVLGWLMPSWGMVSSSLLFNAVVTALTALVLLAYLETFGFHIKSSLLVALTFGVSTLAWPYAKSLFSDPFSGLMLLSAALCLHQAELVAKRQSLYRFGAGLFLAWNVAARYAEAVFVPLFGLYLLWQLWKERRRDLTGFGNLSGLQQRSVYTALFAFGLPLALTASAIFAFNISRYGHPLNTGYLPNESFSGIWWQGIVGQLISPGRGLLLYCPIFVLSLIGLIPFWLRYRAESLLAGAVIVIHILLYGKWFMWHGGYAWGPRFMIPTLPFWALFLAPIAEAFRQESTTPFYRVLRGTFIGLFALGLIPQLQAVLIDFAPFQDSLLDGGLQLFAPATFFEWQYSPFMAAWTFISMTSLDVAWAWQGEFNVLLLIGLLVNLGLSWLGLLLIVPPKLVRRMGASWFGQSNQHSNPPARGGAKKSPLWGDLGGQWYGTKLELNGPPPARSGSNLLLQRVHGLWLICLVVLLSNLLAVHSLMAHSHQLTHPDASEAVVYLNQHSQPDDLILRNDPDSTMGFAEQYDGQSTVLGLNVGGFPLPNDPDDIEARLADSFGQHDRIWWMPNWLPPHESALEHRLREQGHKAYEQSFGNQRLLLFLMPTDLVEQPLPAATVFSDTLRLTNLAMPPSVAAGDFLPLAFTWQTDQPLETDYQLFVHMIDLEGQLIAQTDGQPVNWLRPTRSWQVGETIQDRHTLAIPRQPYTLRIGWYDPQTGVRLLLPDGTDALEVTIARD